MPTPPHWPAPTAAGAVDAVIELPGSKSMTNRALVLAALAAGPSVIRRPLRSRDTLLMATALRTLGVDIDDGGRAGLPFIVRGRGTVKGGSVEIDASGSSQLVSGLLLAAPRFAEGVEVRHAGPPVPSAPHLAMTVRMLRAAGISVDDATPDVWRVAPGSPRGGMTEIEPDLSNAAQFLGAALVTGGRVTVRDWPAATTQPGDALRDLLVAMGAEVSHGADGLTVRGAGGGTFGGLHADLPDGLEIRPRPLRGGVFRTYDDHRMVMAAALIGLAVPGIEVENAATVGKTLPEFTKLWEEMLR